MLLHRFGLSLEQSNHGPARRRSSAHLAIVRLERLEDRFLLSGNPTGEVAGPPAPFPPTIYGASTSNGVASTEKGDVATGASGTTTDSGSQNSDPTVDLPTVPCAVDTSGSVAPQGAGGETFGSGPASTYSGSAQSWTISIPSPMPPGVPAGGIFRQSAIQSIGVLALDPVAVDLSLPGSAAAGASGLPAVVPAGRPISLGAQPVVTTLGSGFSNPSVRPSPGPAVRPHQSATIAGPVRQRAALPDVKSFMAADVQDAPGSDVVQQAEPEPPGGLNLPLEAHSPIEVADVPTAQRSVLRREVRSLQSERDEESAPANLVIYSAASLMVAVSAPGMTPLVRRGTRRSRGRDGDRTRSQRA